MKKTSILQERVRVLSSNRVAEILGSKHPEVCKHIDRIRHTVTNPLTLAVMGEFSAGKSTFINRLLHIDALPVAIIPKTATITKLVYGTEPKVEVEYNVEGKSLVQVSDGYNKLKSIHNARKVDDATFMKEINSIREIRVYVNHPLLKRFTLVDTPGFNHDEAMDKKSADILDAVDIVLWVSDYSQLAKKTEFERLESIRNDVSHLYLVINKADVQISNSDEYHHAYDAIRTELQKNDFMRFFDTENVFLISCKDNHEFWDAKFEQFSSSIGREVLDDDMAISIDIIQKSWEQIPNALDVECKLYTGLKAGVGQLKNMMCSNHIRETYFEKICSQTETELASLWRALIAYGEQCKKLADTGMPYLDEYLKKYLFIQVYKRLEALQKAYHHTFNCHLKEYTRDLLYALTGLNEQLPVSLVDTSCQLQVIIAYLELSLEIDHMVNLEKDSLPATRRTIVAYGDVMSNDDLLTDAFECDIQHDLHTLVSNEALHALLKITQQQLKKAIQRLDASKVEMEKVS